MRPGGSGSPLRVERAVKSSPITDPLSWLVEASRGCICGDSLDELILAYMFDDACMHGYILVRTCSGLRFYVPCSYVGWAWANIVHIVCLDDYGVVVESRIPRGGVVVDVGGGFGYFALLAAQLGAGAVHVFEPNPAARRIIEYQASILGYEGVVVIHPYAVSERDRLSEFYVSSNIVNSSLSRDYLSSRGVSIESVVRVPTVSTGTMFKLVGSELVDLLKLDVEGYEEPIIGNIISSRLFEKINCVVVEAHTASSFANIVRMLARTGFREVHVSRDEEFSQYFIHMCRG
jgi:FkbM family methyltransferase